MRSCCAVLLPMLFTLPMLSQSLTPLRTFSNTDWSCQGVVWVANSDMFCKDLRTHELSKVTLEGEHVYSHLAMPSVGRSTHVVAVTEDTEHNIYAVDGLHIHIYSPDGRYKESMTPGLTMSVGIAVLDPQHIYVAGRTATADKKTPSRETVFLVNRNGIQNAFSGVFFTDLSRLADIVVNTPSYLALDRNRGLLYQLPQKLYEVRVFDLDGNLIRKIVPPAQYGIQRPPIVENYNPHTVRVEPGDGMVSIAVLPDGRIAITGVKLVTLERKGSSTGAGGEGFVDIYDSDGNFQKRLSGTDTEISGASLLAFDQITGKAYLRKDHEVIESEVR